MARRRKGSVLTSLIVLGGVFTLGVGFARLMWKPKQAVQVASGDQPQAAAG